MAEVALAHPSRRGAPDPAAAEGACPRHVFLRHTFHLPVREPQYAPVGPALPRDEVHGFRVSPGDEGNGVLLRQNVAAVGAEDGEGAEVPPVPEMVAGPAGAALYHPPLAAHRAGTYVTQDDLVPQSVLFHAAKIAARHPEKREQRTFPPFFYFFLKSRFSGKGGRIFVAETKELKHKK